MACLEPPVSWNSTDDTIAFSSSTHPQFVHTQSPLASLSSMADEPHLGHSMAARDVGCGDAPCGTAGEL